MRYAHAVLLLPLVFTAMPIPGEEMDHAHMELSQEDHSSGADAAVKGTSRDAHGSDNALHGYMLFDQLEVRDDDRGTAVGWAMTGWIGTDLDRLWLRSEGEIVSGHTHAAELELLYGRSISTWWDLVAGVRQDFRPREARTFFAIGVRGLAPQRIELAATAYIGQRGQSAARLRTDYDLLLANRVVLQPHIEADVHGRNNAARGLGSGLSTVQAGLRLRHEITRQFAPYVGVDWERAFGRTAELRQEEARGVSELRAVIGVRAWY